MGLGFWMQTLILIWKGYDDPLISNNDLSSFYLHCPIKLHLKNSLLFFLFCFFFPFFMLFFFSLVAHSSSLFSIFFLTFCVFDEEQEEQEGRKQEIKAKGRI